MVVNGQEDCYLIGTYTGRCMVTDFKTCKMSAVRKASEKAFSIILHRKHRFQVQQKVGAGTRGMEGRVSHEYVLYR